MSSILSRLLTPSDYAKYLKLLYWRRVVPVLLRRKGVSFDRSVVFHGMPVVSLAEKSFISIGPRCALCSSSEYTALGVGHPVVLRTMRPGASIVIGSDTGMSGGAICAAQRVEIGCDVLMGADVKIFDNDFHAIKPEGRRHNASFEDIAASPVVIEDNVFLGTGAIVCKGVRIGKNSVVGAGSVVVKDIPPNAIAAGNPARVIREIENHRDVKTR